MPRKIGPCSLYYSCLQYLFKYSSNFGRNWAEQFDLRNCAVNPLDLPGNICDDLWRYSSKRGLINMHQINLFLHQNQKVVRLYFLGNKNLLQIGPHKVLNMIAARCNNLEALILTSLSPDPRTDEVCTRSIANVIAINKFSLVVLDLSMVTLVNDDLIEYISSIGLMNLKKLFLGACRSGIQKRSTDAICGLTDGIIGLKQLEYLDLLLTDIEIEGIINCIKFLPNLGRLLNSKTDKALLEMEPKFETVFIAIEVNSVISNDPSLRLSDIFDLTPKLQTLALNLKYNRVDFSLITRLQYLTELSINCDETVYDNCDDFIDNMEVVIDTIGPKITKLKLIDFCAIDIGKIIKNCVKLDYLHLSDGCNNISHRNRIFPETDFDCNLFGLKDLILENISISPGQLANLIASNKFLRQLSLQNIDALCEKTLKSVLSKNNLSHLQTMSVRNCKNFNFDAVMQLIRCDNPLHNLILVNCDLSKKNVDDINDLIEKSNLCLIFERIVTMHV